MCIVKYQYHNCRLAYGVWLLTEIFEKCPKDIKLFMMYDLACHLVRHLRVSMHLYWCKQLITFFHLQANGETELLEWVHFAISSFHVHCHIPACQVCVFTLLITESSQLHALE